ncbi:MAG: hypothetical protein NTZ83_00790 [Candidatus Pacearchaeota archaeon]|nr:hypothetical protein [Candidatus Pacearchaeota archaeon]
MSVIICSNTAYKKINESGLIEKILNRKEVLHNIFLYHSIWNEETEDILNKVRKFYLDSERGISEKSVLFKDIIDLDDKIDKSCSFLNFDENLIEKPCFLGYLVLGDNVSDYKKYNFSSLRSLVESISSFCVGEQQLLRNFQDEYVWRNKTYRNEISQNIHGDLHASQADVSGKIYLDKTLFDEEEEIFNSYKEVWPYGISAYQDWSEFLVASLKYAEYLGKEKMKEIVNWKDALEEAGGGVGTNTAEAEFGTDFSEGSLNFLMDTPIFQEGIMLKQFPLSIYSQFKNSYYPFFENGKLFYLMENKSGNISMESLSHVYKDNRFSKILEYNEEDLPSLLTATYKYFARDRSKMYKIMDYFNSKRK